MRKIPATRRVCSSPVARFVQVTCSRCRSPCSAVISVVRCSVIRSGTASIRLTRYSDMLAARDSPRTRTWTWDAARERKIAACPAELPPPTTTASSPSTSPASIAVAA